MSKEVAKEIVKRAKTDTAFLEALLKDPDTTLKGFDLTEKEKAFFGKADQKMIEGLSDRCFEIQQNKKRAS
jgi:hypothetical protein